MRTLLLLALVVAVASDSLPNECVLNGYNRGIGKIPGTCKSGQELNGDLCYPVCKQGYKGVGPECWEQCPPNFVDIGVSCQKPPPYGRGTGYVHKADCEKDHPDTGCEEWGDLYYPKCRNGFHNFDCCVCSPNCPGDMTDAGEDCTKNVYGRGVGVVPGCDDDHAEQAGLCYKNCRDGYTGEAEMCWEKDCPPNTSTHKCTFECVDNSKSCRDEFDEVETDLINDAIALAIAIEGGNVTEEILDAVKLQLDLEHDFPDHLCDSNAKFRPSRLH